MIWSLKTEQTGRLFKLYNKLDAMTKNLVKNVP